MKTGTLQLHHTRTVFEILRDNLCTLFNGVMLLCAATLAAAGEWTGLGFFAVTLANAGLRIGHDLSARSAMRRLGLRHSGAVRAVRDGAVCRLPGAALRVGDLCTLGAGEDVPADCTVESGAAEVAEALLFGGSHTAEKTAGGVLYAGSRIERGECIARVTAVQENSLAHRMEREAYSGRRRHKTELQRGQQALIRILAAVSLPMAAAKLLHALEGGGALPGAAVYAASAVVGLIPAMMVLLSSWSLLLGAYSIKKSRVVAHDLFCVEMLARADVLCFDKTGTLTHRTPDGGLREDTAALHAFTARGARIVILSGDTEARVAEIAAQCGLPREACDCRTLETCGEYAEAATRYGAFSHALPEQKAALVHTLRLAGHTVAMVGDGVNDVAALYEADCSVSLGRGAGAARRAAQLVLTENTIAVLPEIADEGRRVVNNIERTTELFLKKSICTYILYLAALLLQFQYPYTQFHWTVINLLGVMIPAAVLATEQQIQPIRGRFLDSVVREAIPGALLHILYITGAVHLGQALGLSAGQHMTLCCYAAAAAGLCVLFHVCSPLDRLRAILCIGMTVCMGAALLLLRGQLGIELPGAPALLFSAVFAAAGYPLMTLFARGTEKIEQVCLYKADRARYNKSVKL